MAFDFNSVWETTKQKATNPFFATLIGVWLVRNWELVYTLFNFDSVSKLADKKRFIIDYYANREVGYEVWTNVWVTTIILLIGYILLLFSRFLANVIEHRFSPHIMKFASSKLIANRRLLEELEERFAKKSEDLLEQRRVTNELELMIVETKGRYEVAEANIKRLTDEITGLKFTASNSDTEITMLREKVGSYADEISYHEKFQRKIYDLLEQGIPIEVSNLYLKLRAANKLGLFFALANEIKRSETLISKYDETDLKYFIAWNLIAKGLSLKGMQPKYSLKTNGETLLAVRDRLERSFVEALL